MSDDFVQVPLKEYPQFPRRVSPEKDIFYRFRLLKEVVDGVSTIIFDMRKFLSTERFSYLTKAGLFFNKEEIKTLITYLQDALKVIEEIEKKKEENKK
jgi:hypothetical protein